MDIYQNEAAIMATSEALLLNFKAGETINTVSRETVKLMGSKLGFNDTQLVQFALAKLREQIIPAYPANAPELSEKAIQTIKAQVNQKGYKPTRSLFKGL